MAAVRNLKKKKVKKVKKVPRRPAPDAEYQPGNILTLRETVNWRYNGQSEPRIAYYIIVFLDVWKIRATHYSTLILHQDWYRGEWHYYFDIRSEGQLKKHYINRPNVEVLEKDLKFLVLNGSPLTMVQNFLRDKIDIRLDKELEKAQKTLKEVTNRIQLISNVKKILLEESDDRADSESPE